MPKYLPGESGNPTGRPKGSSNRIPSNKEIKEGFKKLNNSALVKLAAFLSGDDPDLSFKASVKILDVNYQIMMEEEKQDRISKRKLQEQKHEKEVLDKRIEGRKELQADDMSVSVSSDKKGKVLTLHRNSQ